MNSHWPVLLAIVMVSIAVYFGLRRQSELSDAAVKTIEYRKLPKSYNPNAPVAGAPANATPPANRTLPGTPPATLQPSAPPRTMAPVQPPTGAANPFAPAPIVATNPPGTFTTTLTMQPGMITQPGAPGMGGPVDRDALFGVLRASLQQQFGAAPMITNTGFAVVVDGARIDVDAAPNWSINLFNNTKAQPPVQTPNFLMMQNIVAATLDFDLKNTAVRQTGDGKTVQRPISKLGKLIVETDPAMFNSVSIRPLSKTDVVTTPPGTGNAPVTRVPAANQPGAPMAVPPAPPAAPKAPAPIARPPRAPDAGLAAPQNVPPQPKTATQPKAAPQPKAPTQPKTQQPPADQF